MQYKVPQNIDQEDKIFGPLTFIQFIYVLIGGAAILLLFTVVRNIIVFIILAIPIAAITAAFALIKVQDQPFSRFFLAFIVYAMQPKKRVWKDIVAEVSKQIAAEDAKKATAEATSKTADVKQQQNLQQQFWGSKESTKGKKAPAPKSSSATSDQPKRAGLFSRFNKKNEKPAATAAVSPASTKQSASVQNASTTKPAAKGRIVPISTGKRLIMPGDPTPDPTAPASQPIPAPLASVRGEAPAPKAPRKLTVTMGGK